VKKLANLVLSLLVTLILVAWLIQYVQMEQFLQVMTGLCLPWFFVSVAMLAVYQWLRGLRIRLFITPRPSSGPLFGAMCLQGLLNSVLPSWLGEAALVYLLKRFFAQGVHSSAAAILVVRIADLGFIFLMFLFMATFLLDQVTRPFIIVALVLLAIIAAAVIFALVVARLGMAREPGARREGMAGKITGQLQKLSHSLAAIGEKKIYTPMLALTAAMWLAQYIVFVAVVWALRVDLSLTVIFGVYLIGFSVNLLPVKGVANFGTHETAWFIALRAFGADASLAAMLGFGSHIVILVMHAILGGSAALYLYSWRGEEKASAPDPL